MVNHYNVQPVIDVYASTQGRDLGGVASDIMKALKPFQDHLPRGSQDRGSRAGRDDAVFIFRIGRRLSGRDRARLSSYRGELPVVARSIHHYYGVPGSAGWESAGSC